MIKAWNNLEQLREADKAKAWLFSIVRNTSVDIYRKKKRVVYFECPVYKSKIISEMQSNDGRPEDNVYERYLQEMIESVIDSMNTDYAEIIRLWMFSSLSTEQICSRLNISEKLRSVRLCRAKKELRKKLEEIRISQALFEYYMV